MKKIKQLIVPFLFVLLVASMPIIAAESVPLTQKEINKYKRNEFGLISYGHFWEEYVYEKNTTDDYFSFTTQIILYNTYDIPLHLCLKATQFSNEREHESIRINYTYYYLPNLSWVTAPGDIILPPCSKYITNVTTNIPVEEAFNQRNEGGYIFLIVPQIEENQVNAVPGFKVFVTLIDSTLQRDSNPIPFILFFTLSCILVALVLYKYNKKEKREGVVADEE